MEKPSWGRGVNNGSGRVIYCIYWPYTARVKHASFAKVSPKLHIYTSTSNTWPTLRSE